MTGIGMFILLMSAVAEPAAQPLSIAVVVPFGEAPGKIFADGNRHHFHVVLSNHSATTQRIWDEAYSWGYYALSLRLTTEDGAQHVVKKRDVGFTRNLPDWWRVEPGGHLVLDVYLGDWKGVPPVPPACRPIELRAVFEVAEDAESRKAGVWTGRIESAPEKVLLCR